MKKRAQKLQAQSILATVVMGMNLVNTAAPAAALAAAEQPEPLPKQAVGEARPEDLQACAYEALPTLAGYLDDLVFSKAEAQDYSVGSGGTSHYTKTDDSDKVYVYSGGTCSIDSNHAGGSVYEGGSLNVGFNVGATPLVVFGGNVSITDYRMGDLTVSGGTVNISNNSNNHSVYGGTCTVTLNSAGAQQTIYGGTGIITEMEANTGSDQYQDISGGTGIVGSMTLSQHHQNITAGYGEVVTMSGGVQKIESGAEGHIQEMHGGTQNVYQALAKGTIGTMYDGEQIANESSAIAEIGTMSGGTQTVDGTGKIGNMVTGKQNIGYACNYATYGTVETMTSGVQQVYSAGTGTINTMIGGTQLLRSGGGNGVIGTMNSGMQWLYTGAGKGTVQLMNSGWQLIQEANASGIVEVMSGGSQDIRAGAGTVTALLGGEQIVSSGGKAVDTTIAGGTQDIRSGGIAVSTTIKAGQQIVSVGAVVSGAVLSGGVQQVYDGTNLHDITFEGGTQAVMDGATVSGMQVDSGMQAVTSGGTANATKVGSSGLQYIEAGAVISGTVLDGGVLRLAQADRDYTISDTLTINNGVLDLTDGAGLKRNLRATPVYQKLTMSDLQGSGGSIYMDTDLVNNDGDKITVQNSNTGTGTYGIYVNDRSIITDTELTGHLLLVDDQSKKLNFQGMTVNNGGLWDTTPILNEETNQWYLTKIIKTANNDTQVLLTGVDNSYALWRSTNDSLRSRLGELHGDAEHDNGIWARTQAGRFSGFGYEGRYNLYQLGYDQKADARSTYGFAVDYGDGTGDYTQGSGKDKLTAFSLYGVWQGQRGAYTNVTARAGIFDTDLKSYGDFPDKVSYKEHAYSISVEYGQRFDYQQGLFFEPQAQFTLGRLSGISYTTDRGANGYIEGMNSAIGRIGFVLGEKIKNGSDIYLKADLLHEFAGKRDLQLTSDAGGSNDILRKHNDYGDTWFELGLGANIKLSKSSNFYGEIERGFGGDINKKWSVNAGLRFTF